MDAVPDATPRRSTRLQSPLKSPPPTKNLIPDGPITAPYTPSQIESNKRKTTTKKKGKTPKTLKTPRPSKTPESQKTSKSRKTPKSVKTPKRTYYKKVVYDGAEFAINDDVYVKRKEGSEADDSEPEVEECKICFSVGRSLMIECDDCLGGFHLKCLNPKLKKVPEGDWICGFCERKKNGEEVEMPKPPEGKKLKRTMKEKLLSSDLYAARIERLWKEPNGVFWMRCRWYMIPEETTAGRQPHNLKRELYRTNHSSDVEMETVIRHCFVLNPKEFAEATNAGDDVFYCEYEYDVYYNSFKRISDIQDNDDEENDKDAEKDKEWKVSKSLAYETDDGSLSEDEVADSTAHKYHSHELAANSSKGRTFGLHKIGIKKIPEHVRRRKQTDLEKAKQTLLLATLPKSLPCRNNEMDEIASFIKGAVCGEQWYGRCLYIHGVPGTGKTMSVLAVMQNLRSEVDAGKMRPYSFVEVNGLKLASPENTYKIVYEGLTGNRVGWKKALNLLNERFSDEKKSNKNQPCILLIDELDLLLTRNQSVLYNILDWPTKPNSKLIVIGIANTMDLPEKLLPRISSRMGIQRLCFGPYNYQQLQEIISTRLEGLDAFEKQAIEFASRKVAAMSGDARRALEICRRAAELADYRHKQSSTSEGKCRVGIQDIEAAIQEVFQAPHIQMIKTCSRLGKILLVAMVQELYRSGVSEVTFEKLATTVFSLCSNNKEELPGWDSLLKVGCKLGQCRIILCEEGVRHRLQKLQLNFPSDDVAFALKDCPDIPWLSRYL